jgi:hypothetical protein
MKISTEIKLTCLVLIIGIASSMRLQAKQVSPVQIIQEVHPAQAQLTQVINRTPTISAVVAPSAPLRMESNEVHFENSNTSTQPDTGIYTKKAYIPPLRVVVEHAPQPVTVLQSTPAHVGNRHTTTTVTTVSTEPGKEGQVEEHKVETVSPIIGTIDQV